MMSVLRAFGLATVLVVATGVAACSTKDDRPASDKLQAALASAERLADPVARLDTIERLQDESQRLTKDLCYITSYGAITECPALRKTIDTLDKARLAALDKALDAIPPARLLRYYADENFLQLRKRIGPRIVAEANAAAGASTDNELLFVAGNTLSDGNYVVRNTDQAAAMYARAWLAGSAAAAAANASLYWDIHDANNAYLWALRSKQHPDLPVPTARMRQVLSAEAIRQAEQAATDSTILALAGR